MSLREFRKRTWRRVAVMLAALTSVFAFSAAAHDVPADIRINAFVKPAGDRLELLIRVPFAALVEAEFPLRGQGFIDVSRVTFDGRGQFTINEIGRFNGDPVNRTFTGPYVVNSDCTGYLDYSSTLSNPPHEAHGNFVIVDEAKGLFFTDNEAGWVANGQARRI